MQNNTDVNHPSSASGPQSGMPAVQATSESLPRNVSMQLYELMLKVTAKEVSPGTVNAACNCASAIHKILKLNHDMKRRSDA